MASIIPIYTGEEVAIILSMPVEKVNEYKKRGLLPISISFEKDYYGFPAIERILIEEFGKGEKPEGIKKIKDKYVINKPTLEKLLETAEAINPETLYLEISQPKKNKSGKAKGSLRCYFMPSQKTEFCWSKKYALAPDYSLEEYKMEMEKSIESALREKEISTKLEII
ncbi:MAG TPA: hypothetical protein VJ461_06035 [Candidatus Nanoarchaeia archaeon]|nr:hypothetical protein [Candidatus Nanoarchaeia archaeon]